MLTRVRKEAIELLKRHKLVDAFEVGKLGDSAPGARNDVLEFKKKPETLPETVRRSHRLLSEAGLERHIDWSASGSTVNKETHLLCINNHEDRISFSLMHRTLYTNSDGKLPR